MNFFILNLCIADVYVALGNVLPMIVWRRNNNIFFGGDLACRFIVYIQVVSVYYSTYVLVAITIDRYEAICRPLNSLSWSKKRGAGYILIAFTLAHLQGIPQVPLFALRIIPNIEPPTETCYAIFNPTWLSNVYIIYTFALQFLIPLIVIIICYTNVSFKVNTIQS
jgi:hypothetical protein